MRQEHEAPDAENQNLEITRNPSMWSNFGSSFLIMLSSDCIKDAQYGHHTGSSAVWKKPLLVAESQEAIGTSG